MGYSLPEEPAILLAGGSAISFELDGQYKRLLCSAGVPSELLPTSAVRFVVLSDGKEIWRSGSVTSIDDPLSVALNVSGAKSLMLRVDPATAGVPAAPGVFTAPVLVK